MKREDLFKIFTLVCSFLIIIPIGFQIQIDLKLKDNSTVQFLDIDGNRIFNKYYPGTTNYGIMLFHGMGEDQVSMESFTLKFHLAGFHVFATDFAGHGRSSGVIPGENGSDNLYVNEVMYAKQFFKSISGLTDSSIFMIGHSMGARAILKATTADVNPVNGCILLGVPIHLAQNISQPSWIEDLGTNNPQSNIMIISGTWEDVFPPSDAYSLFMKLSNTSEFGSNFSHVTSEGFLRTVRVFTALPHTYEVCSSRVVKFTAEWITECLKGNLPELSKVYPIEYRSYILIIELMGIILTLIFGKEWLVFKLKNREEFLIIDQKNNLNNSHPNLKLLIISSLKKFLSYKFLIWIGAAGFALILCLIFLILPIGTPFFTLIFVGPISGYGFIHLILYRIGKIPGVNGKWKPRIIDLKQNFNWWGMIFILLLTIIIGIIFSYYLDSILYHIFPLNIRLFWLVLFSLFSVAGFYIYQLERELLEHSKKTIKIIYNLIFLLPFILGTFYILFSGTIIFFFDAIHDLIIVTLVILVGEIFHKISKKKIIIAILQSVLLFLLLLPRGPLMNYF